MPGVPRRLLILGSTGSIGVQALDVVSRAEDLEVVGTIELILYAATEGLRRKVMASSAQAG